MKTRPKNVFLKSVTPRATANANFSASDRYAELPPEKVGPRPQKDIRPLRPDHVVSMMESVLSLDLLQTIAVTSDYCLVAGKHRLAAFKVFKALSVTPEGSPEERRAYIAKSFLDILEGESFSPELLERLERLDVGAFEKKFPDFRVPCKILSFSSKDKQQVLLGEGVENEKRLDFTATQIRTYFERLQEDGYIYANRRPRTGEKPLMPALALATGKSIRRLQQMLNEMAQAESPKSSVADVPPSDFAKLEREMRRAIAMLSERKDSDAKQLVTLLDKSLKLLEKL